MNRLEDFPDDGEASCREGVECVAHRPGEGVLEGKHARIGHPRFDRVVHRREGGHRAGLDLLSGKKTKSRLFAVRTRLALVGNSDHPWSTFIPIATSASLTSFTSTTRPISMGRIHRCRPASRFLSRRMAV